MGVKYKMISSCISNLQKKNLCIGPAHEIFLFIAYAQMPLINVIADVSSEANIGLNFGLRLYLQCI